MAGKEFFRVEMISPGSGPIANISQTIAKAQQLTIFKRCEQAFCKACFMEQSPKPISWTGKVMSDCCTIKAGVYATEQNLQVWGQNIRDSFPKGCLNLCWCGFGVNNLATVLGLSIFSRLNHSRSGWIQVFPVMQAEFKQ